MYQACICLRFTGRSIHAAHYIRFSTFCEYRLWNVQQAGCLADMKLPANTVGDPHAIFDSTGLVFAVTAAMSGGVGNVSSTVQTL
jgi:hypothetical protein